MKKSTLLVALATVLSIGQIVAQTTSESCSNTNMMIVDFDDADVIIPVTSTAIIGTGAANAQLTSVTIDIQHNNAEDLTLTLEAPTLEVVTLAAFNGGADGLDMQETLRFSDDTASADHPNVDTWTDASTLAPTFNSIDGDQAIATALDGVSINGNWIVKVSNQGGELGTVFEVCLNFSNVTLGIQESFASRVVLYPNPASNTLNSTEAIQTYTIYNILGNKVLEGTGQAIDISSLSEGVYMAELTNDGNKTVEKFVVKK